MKQVTLAIDYGVKYVGVALVAHSPELPNRVLYAATIAVESKPLKALVEPRAGTRRIRRTRKTHQRRLRRLAQCLSGVVGMADVIRFCRRRGFSFDADATDDASFHISRDEFFAALEREIVSVIPAAEQPRVLALCARHLNRSRRRSGELRPARFENRGRARCNWEGCNHNVPRAKHDLVGRLQQSLFLWLQPVFAVTTDSQQLRRSVEHWIAELNGLSAALRRVAKQELPAGDAKAARDSINARVKRVYQNLRQRVEREAPPEVAVQFLTNWNDYYRAIVSETIRGEAPGRVQFCRQHSAEFVDHVLAGKVPPVKQSLTARDLVSRTQQIIFERLARLIESRLLPLAGGRIDEIVVERVAFDILSGPIKARQKMSQEQASEIYWHGPLAGFGNRQAMFCAEFDGRCAYCGTQTATLETEHVLPRSRFPFDAYFNLVPACTACNARKAGRTALDAQLVIHPAAYEAYCTYLASRKVLHPYHAIKKGILNLLCRPATTGRGQQLIGMIAENLLSITNTQRSPRPLARYLATRLGKTTGTRPKITHRAARHTALYRSAALPEYDKPAEKAAGDLRNHAVDAIMLACDFPSASALENRQWTRSAEQVEQWLATVRSKAPPIDNGLPAVSPPSPLPFFENELGNGYFRIDLSAFNWNRRRKAAHKLDPFGKTARGVPTKRVPAATILENLRGTEAIRDSQIRLIAHRGLRTRLERLANDAAAEFVRWLQQSVAVGLGRANMSNHPADQARRRLLSEFSTADANAFLAVESPQTIPWIIGVKLLNADTGAPSKVHVVRSLPGNPRAQHYQAEAVVKRLYVCYPRGAEGPDRSRPLVLAVNQIDAVARNVGGKWKLVEVPAESPLRGRPLGTAEPILEFRRRWQEALDALFLAEGIGNVFTLAQGCVIEKLTGERFQLRNFDKSAPWMTSTTFKDIHRIHRSPLAALREGTS